MYVRGDEPSRMGDSPNGPTAPVARDRTVHDTLEAVRDSLGFDGTGRVAFVETENRGGRDLSGETSSRTQGRNRDDCGRRRGEVSIG